MAWASACPTLNSREKIPINDASSLANSSSLTERNEFCGVFSHGQAQRLNSPLQLIEIKILKAQGIPEQDLLAVFSERKGSMDQRAIHLEQATEYVARIDWNVHNHLLEDQQWFLTVDYEMVDPTLIILNDEDVLGRIFVHNYQVEFMHVAFNGLKICHPRPLQAAMITPPPVERTVCLRDVRWRFHPVHQCAQHVSSRGYDCIIVAENAEPCWGLHVLATDFLCMSCCPEKRMA